MLQPKRVHKPQFLAYLLSNWKLLREMVWHLTCQSYPIYQKLNRNWIWSLSLFNNRHNKIFNSYSNKDDYSFAIKFEFHENWYVLWNPNVCFRNNRIGWGIQSKDCWDESNRLFD